MACSTSWTSACLTESNSEADAGRASLIGVAVLGYSHHEPHWFCRRVPSRPIYPIDPIFENSSYTRRCQILFERLVQEQHYDAACLVTTRNGRGILQESIAEVLPRNFSTSIAGRVECIRNLA